MDEDFNETNTLLTNMGMENENTTQLKHIANKCQYHTVLERNHFMDNFSILHLNARSMKNKFDNLNNLITRTNVQWDIICISETWLKDDIVKYFQIENYNLFASCRPVGEGGGTAVYVQVSRISVVGCSDTETCLRSASAPRPPAHAQYVLDDC